MGIFVSCGKLQFSFLKILRFHPGWTIFVPGVVVESKVRP